MDRDARKKWSETDYLSRSLGHRFCLVVQGDFPGTPKIAEMLAMGGAGGCIPVFVMKLTRDADGALASSSRAMAASTINHGNGRSGARLGAGQISSSALTWAAKFRAAEASKAGTVSLL